MPNAQVVADRFHVMTQINKELDTQIKREKRKVEDLMKKANATDKLKFEEILAGLKNSKYPLLKNKDNLTQEQLDKLIQVKNVSPILKEMHEFKEKIRRIFNNTNDWYTGVFKLGMWLSRAKKYFPKGIEGLWELPGRGCKPKCGEEDIVFLEECLKKEPRTYNSVQLAQKLESERQIQLSPDRLRRVLKKRGSFGNEQELVTKKNKTPKTEKLNKQT